MMANQITKVLLKAAAFALAFMGVLLFFGEENDVETMDFIVSVLLHKSAAVLLFFVAYALNNFAGTKPATETNKSNQ